MRGVPEDPEARRALACLRAHTGGTLLVDGSPRPVRFVTDHADGTLVMPVDPRDLDGAEFVLALPEDSFDAQARAVLELARLGEDGAWADRHGAYHGPTRAGVWARGRVLHVKLAAGPVVDGEEVMVPNPFAREQTRLCAELNRDRGRLARACARASGATIEGPFAVGVDPLGADVRARFGVVRLAFEEPAPDADAALRMLAALA